MARELNRAPEGRRMRIRVGTSGLPPTVRLAHTPPPGWSDAELAASESEVP